MLLVLLGESVRHVWWHVGLVLGIVDGGVGHVGKSIHGRLLRSGRADGLRAHVRSHPADVLSRTRPRSHARLRGVAALYGKAMVLRERHAIRNWR